MTQHLLDKTSTKYLMRRLFREHIKQYLPRFFLAFGLMMVVAATTAAMAKLIQPVLDEIFVSKNKEMLHVVALMVITVFVVKSLATYGQDRIMNEIGFRIVSDLQTRLFNHLMRSDISFFHANPTGTLMSRLTSDVRVLQATTSATVTSLGKDSLTLIALVSVMFYQDWKLATASFFAFPLAIYPIARIGKRIRKVSGVSQQEMGIFASSLSQIFLGIRQVKAYCREPFEIMRVGQSIHRMLELTLKGNRIRSGASPIMDTLGGLAIVVVILYGGSQVINGAKTTGAFFSFITALLLAYEPVKKLSRMNTQLQEGMAAAQRLFEVIDTPVEVNDDAGKPALSVKEGALVFDKVDFHYKSENQVLYDISFTVPAGKTVALVGASGSGKSTIINLIPRFYNLSTGSISIDDTDISTVSLHSLRENIGLVSQEIALFDDSVYNNILYGRLDATEAEVMEAARRAAAHEFIVGLPQGYQTRIGEQGVALSGGQRQRLAIARAMLKDAPILLLDEATSALDTVSEQKVQAVLNTLMQGKTTLVVAHRLSTIVDADVIHVMSEGRIIERGTHAELLAKQGAYAGLYTMQFREGAVV
jgi:subfamily B ATP-binding cassette protein MsbA